MSINLAAVGRSYGPHPVSWTEREVMLYALGVGAGQADPLVGLNLTTENTEGQSLQVLPTFATVAGPSTPRDDFGNFPSYALLHAEQEVISHRPLPPSCNAHASFRIEGIFDLGADALVVVRRTLTNPQADLVLAESVGTYFVRGEGGFGGERPVTDSWAKPADTPGVVASSYVRPDQALLYRLSGDSNPLHSDPAEARRAGFDRPILHGLCTFGITARLITEALCDGDPDRLLSIRGRFSRPTFPGCTLTVQMWSQADGVWFQTSDERGTVAIDRGRCQIAPDPKSQ